MLDIVIEKKGLEEKSLGKKGVEKTRSEKKGLHE